MIDFDLRETSTIFFFYVILPAGAHHKTKKLQKKKPITNSLILYLPKAMVKGEFVTNQPLTHVQKDLKLALGMSELLEHPLPITATTNEIYKHAKRIGYAEHDSSAIYIRSKF